jgi:arylsulfatase
VTKNIIILTIDALRADHVSWLGYKRDTTPYLDELSERCTLFEAAYSVSSHTREAVPALLTGQYPPEAVGDGFTRDADTIPMLLPDEYSTAAFHSNPYISRAYDYDEGFDTFYDDLHLGHNKLLALVQRALDKFVLNRGEYHARAEEINRHSLSWLSSLSDSEPFFLWNHYMDVHGPYNPPDGYAKWSDNVSNVEAQRLYNTLSGDEAASEGDIELAKNLYDGEIRYVDYQISQFIDGLAEFGLLDESLLLITSDHGDLFGEYGEFAHPRYVYPELTRVPLILSDPNIRTAMITAPVSLLDVVPTALTAANSPVTDLDGHPLQAADRLDKDRPVYSSAIGGRAENEIQRFAVQTSNRGVRFTRHQETGELTQEAYYLLPSGMEVENEGNPEFQSLRARLTEHSERCLRQVTPIEAEGDTLANDEVEERLEALGYR